MHRRSVALLLYFVAALLAKRNLVMAAVTAVQITPVSQTAR
jgi:hypothetical protein